MRIAFITRSTLYEVPGGDTIQVMQTVKYLKKSGADASIFLTNSHIDYSGYDLFHFSNITRPSDILFHLSRIKKPFVISPILIDYSEYDRQYRKGLAGLVLKRVFCWANEYIKKLFRWGKGTDKLKKK